MKKKPGIVNTRKIVNRLFMSSLLIGICFVSTAQVDSISLKKTLPKQGKMQHNKPKGKDGLICCILRQNGILKTITGSLLIHPFMEKWEGKRSITTVIPKKRTKILN